MVYIKVISKGKRMPKRYKASELIKMIGAHGWYEVSQNGSHKKFRHATSTETIILPVHNGDIATGTANKVLKQAGLK
jgi:predicted RNA binding protein YcfA (HicA-like mRNA interferase family)